MDSIELRDLGAAWVVLSVAFANLYGDLFDPLLFTIALTTVGVGFLLHELAHRAVAHRFGLRARFEAYYNYLGLAFLFSFAGFIFAAPGAVYTEGPRTQRQQMLISVAGPVTNIVLGVLFLLLPPAIGRIGDPASGVTLAAFGHRINVWLALFNMIPVGGLDGQAVLRHSKPVYAAVVIVAGILFLL